jgi:hypothetical protein
MEEGYSNIARNSTIPSITQIYSNFTATPHSEHNANEFDFEFK